MNSTNNNERDLRELGYAELVRKKHGNIKPPATVDQLSIFYLTFQQKLQKFEKSRWTVRRHSSEVTRRSAEDRVTSDHRSAIFFQNFVILVQTYKKVVWPPSVAWPYSDFFQNVALPILLKRRKNCFTVKMKLNCKKTKEIVLGPLQKDPPPQLVVDNLAVERVTSFKLLGIHLSSNMKWDAHIAFICAKTASN